MSDMASRNKPTRPQVENISDLTMIVRPPGRPQTIQAYTDAERADAELYAAEFGAEVATLPLPLP